MKGEEAVKKVNCTNGNEHTQTRSYEKGREETDSQSSATAHGRMSENVKCKISEIPNAMINTKRMEVPQLLL